MSVKEIWLIGAGAMAIEYAKVLKDLPCSVTVIGRGGRSATIFEEKTGIHVVCGGLAEYLMHTENRPDMAIVATGVLDIAENARFLMDAGVKRVLLEKPGGINKQEIDTLSQRADIVGGDIFIAYNRRFYASVLGAQTIIKEDGGVTSFQFDFTEWTSVIEKLEKPAKELNSWFLTNSGHVLDMAFFLCGEPARLEPLVAGNLPWHLAGSIFVGTGISKSGALFCYHANWDSAGRWGVEVNTAKRKLIFRPLEKLQIMMKDSVEIKFAELNYELDEKYKPGIYLQTQAFLNSEDQYFMTIQQQAERMIWNYKIIDTEIS